MKKRRKFIDNVKQLYLQHQKAINYIMLIISIIGLFVGTCIFTIFGLLRPMNDNQFKECEQIARDVYAQKDQVIVEVPADFSVDIDETAIIIETNRPFSRGKVIARLKNGELVITRDLEIADTIVTGLVLGIAVIIVLFFLISGICGIIKKVKNSPEE